ncbi:uncharacterized protein LOC133532788 [Cydia pomonella]|uniref:uncharacterized protein LOC133532788 n=1 Tax=Cydia pomonella TaxID=82600 RepID=UPI002ADE688E|nr:uncharacterized protein LOC133532788 [Cydia pomonella]
MYCDPMMLEDLTGLLIKFRCHKIGITADVEKAFLQIGLHDKDRDVTRFLWLKDVSKPAVEENLIHYRFTRVPFGIISSPFLLNATIKYHLSKTNDERLKSLANDIYVDNVLTGSNSVKEAMSLYKDSKTVFQQISMNLREWSSNSKELMRNITDASTDKTVKTLGLNWDLENDTICLRIKNTTNAYTKRGILKTIAAIYDPCGFAAPIILPAKLLLQKLWKTKSHWDAPLSEEMAAEWKTILEDLKQTHKICLPRNITDNQEGQLHCFTDSSMSAYAAVVYLLQGDKVNFIIGKSRLIPLKDQDNLKIPKLELLGALIGSRLIQYVMKHLQVNISQQVLWTDSQIVIDWYQSKKLLPPFISRRIEEIKKNKNLAVRYVPSEHNPADVATRPTNSTEDFQRWLSGPKFLKEDSHNWPYRPARDVTLLAGEGLSNNTTQKAELNSDTKNQLKKNIDLSKAQKHQTETRQIFSETRENVNNRISSEVQEIRSIQRQFYPDEVNDKMTHLTRNLRLFKDVDRILRCGGRLTHSDLSYDAKYPILLPKDCEFTTKTIKKAHENNYHVGVPHTLDIVRQRFWIPQGRAQVQKFINKCPQCVKHGGGPYTLPETPALPPERVKYETAYTYVGVDYFGPMYVKAEGKQKRWICLFTCLVIRAIHLEIVKDMSAEECLLAFRRFMATRGVPTLIVTDNALQFKLLSEIITTGGPTDQRIQWKFIPQLAPWHGGVYERLVAVVKHCLKRTLQKHLLDDNQLLTIMKEVESVVNTRPLTYVGTGLEHVLKPADFLTPGRCLGLQMSVSKAPITATVTKQQLIEGWRRGETIMKEYRDMFMNQYLLSLREHYKHSTKQPRVRSHDVPCVGDIIQIKGDTKNRENWKVGRISELIKGTDGLYRVAKVKVDNNIFTRSISHLYPLEIEDIPSQTDLSGHQAEVESAPKAMRMEVEEDSDLPMTQREDYPNMQPDGSTDGTDSMDTDTTHSIDRINENTDVTNENVDTAEEDIDLRHGNVETTNDLVDKNNESASNQSDNERQRRNAAVQAMERIREWTRHLMTTLTTSQ